MTANRFNFRVWDKTYNQLFYDAQDTYDFTRGTPTPIMADSFGELIEDTENFHLMQSTGMVDKNNKEIFEGDLIRDENNDLFIVQFNTAYDIQTINQIEPWTTNLSLEDNETDFDMVNHKIMWYKNYINKKVEVIGNIYENKELLKEVN